MLSPDLGTNVRRKAKNLESERELRLVSLKTISTLVDAHRSTVRRWLTQASIRPIVLGQGRNGAIRYHWRDIERWLTSRAEVD